MRKEFFIIMGSVAVISLIVVFLIIPGLDAISASNAKLSENQLKIDDLNNFSEKMASMTEKYNTNQAEIEKLATILPTKEQLPDLLVQLETLAGMNGLVMQSVDFAEAPKNSGQAPLTVDTETDQLVPAKAESATPAAVQPAESSTSNYNTMVVNMNLTGTYQSLKKYLDAVEKNERLMDVINLGFNSSAGQGASANFSIGIALNVYYE